MLAAALIVLATVAAYHNGLGGPFVYDDITSIERNPTICQLWPLGPVLSPPCDGETVGGRPLLNLSLAINYAIGGLSVRGYHVTNLAIHAAAALLLFGILRRTFLTAALCDRFGRAATLLAFASALLWAVHPLQTESVTYIVQRAESLAGLLYLLTLYCLIRGAGTVPFFAPGKPNPPKSVPGEKGDCPPSPPQTDAGETPALHWQGKKGDCPLRPISWLWCATAVLACLAGMACKEVVVTAPLVALLYDRTFLAGSFQEALRRRWGLYLGLAATWGLLAYLMFSTRLIFRHEQMGAPDWWSYARTQPGVILLYLRLSAWPYPLCFDYAWPVADTLWEILPGALVVGLLLAATLWGLVRRRAWGFLGTWFLLILAPTSSVLPLGQLAFEHRMYLSLAAVTVLAVVGGYALWDRWTRPAPRSPLPTVQSPPPSPTTPARWAVPIVAWVAAATALGSATIARNGDYGSPVAIYQDTVNKRPYNPVAQYSLGSALAAEGKIEAALEHYEKALCLKPDYPKARYNLGNALARLGKYSEAIDHYAEALRLKPDYAEVHHSLGFALASLGGMSDAIEHYQQALRLKPDYAEVHNALGVALAAAGKTGEAIEHYREALRLKPEDPATHNNLAIALVSVQRIPEAIERYQEALRLKPDYAEAYNNLALALAAAGRPVEAIEHYRRALRLKPDYATALYNLADLLASLGKTNEAIECYQHFLQWRPNSLPAHNSLAWLLATQEVDRGGDPVQAVRLAERARELAGPQNIPCLDTLAAAYAAAGRFADAASTAEQAVQLAESSGQASLVKRIQARLELYRNGQPYREPPRLPGP